MALHQQRAHIAHHRPVAIPIHRPVPDLEIAGRLNL